MITICIISSNNQKKCRNLLTKVKTNFYNQQYFLILSTSILRDSSIVTFSFQLLIILVNILFAL